MKWLFVLLLAVIVFGGAAFFSYELFVKPERKIIAEKSGEIPVSPIPDISGPEFEALARLRQENKLTEARDGLALFLQKYPSGLHVEEAKDLLGDVNTEILLSPFRSPEKEEYVVKSGDVLAKIAAKTRTTPELIMRTNNLANTMLRVGERLLISHPDFSLFIQRKTQIVVLLDRGQFFKRYHVKNVRLSTKQPSRINTRVAEVLAFRDGKRVGFGTKEYVGSTRWIRLNQPGYFLYSEPDATRKDESGQPPPPGLGMAASDVEELSSLVSTKTPVTITD
ncbi:MAG TPA: LysM peptidoglycan-binding domain-containing protein [Chthoniobacterales bacterium]|jgi:LysM repeat protein|nr:LysM peptidoglycan-binding domain-containing protein [Chthoniobacterales bacterium]